ncbi:MULTISPECIES: ABC transporter permease [unclassified Methanoculleus]|uniref:ABC transporter permease n=1 Tax=unclassified Methanoculleus TaxID=2619537 RepID=UPI0025CFB217|nr:MULTISPECIES: ABC transporter permease [unclassified Methanoculleus]MCK9318668.1 ABC transporter permease [Methanoculleus sp.]MDD2254551.1 ABC transporter permease [Methanoculleus sp.]MDD2787115.1 ABC transporter permease [Methanoculleus sp.]MDD3215987.1 ABC transporter permease [Methanoculleus sp.]MDD4314090.1 ABC transporter permease [Methanoculleus sp.]
MSSEKTIVFAILLQVFIAMFSSFLMVGLTTMYDPEAIEGYSTVNYGVGYAGAESALIDEFEKRPDLVLHRTDLDAALRALRDRRVAAVVYVPDTPPDAEEPVMLTLYLIQNDLQSSVINVKLKEVLQGYEEELREVRADRRTSFPIGLNFPESGGGENFFEFVYGLLIPLLVLLPAVVSAALIIDLITEEYQRQTLETLMSTPVTFREMVWGKVAACAILVPVQAGAWLLLLRANGIAVNNAAPILLHVSAGGLFLILVGALVGLHYRERTSAQFIFSTALVVVFLFVLAVPYNPFNLIVRLAVDTASPVHWLVLALVAGATALLGWAATAYARRVGEAAPGTR